MITKLDHVVILVDDLPRAVESYAACGFQVTPGGRHAAGTTHNALVPFADGAYLELIAFTRPDPSHRWWRHVAAGPGIIDFALLPTDPAADIEAARSRGVALAGPIAGGRIRPDGVRLDWLMGIPEDPVLPFLCGDVTPRSLRVPGTAATAHSNTAEGVDEVVVVVDDLDAAARQYERLLGRPTPAPSVDEALGASVRRLQLGECALALVRPDRSADAALRERLALRGPGPAAVALRAAAGRDWSRLDPELTVGAVIYLRP